MRIIVAFLLVGVLGTACYRTFAAEEAKKPAAAKLDKPKTVTREEWGSEPKPIPESRKHIPKFITIHHGGVDWKPGKDPMKFMKDLQKYGQVGRVNEGKPIWLDLPYHFMIAPDGRIFEGRPIEYEPESNTKYDLEGHIGVEFMGNFETQRPSDAQLKSAVAIVSWLSQELKIPTSDIATHRDRAKGQTTCPGKDFYRYMEDGQFIGWVKQTLAGEKPDVKPGDPLPGGPTVVIDTPVPEKKSFDEKKK